VRASWRALLVGLAVTAWALFVVRPAAAASSADELVRQARAHEAVHEDDVAVRRYMEALSVDPTSGDAWMGLGALRMKLGDPTEAERVYAAALEHVPGLHVALRGRAHALWAMARRHEAEDALDAYATLADDVGALRELADWYAIEGRTPAQLAAWRRLLARAARGPDAEGTREARRMVRALVILVDGADPAASPPQADGTRRALAAIARRGG
jgi:tetratricopeptide (TPR) repeat protein